MKKQNKPVQSQSNSESDFAETLNELNSLTNEISLIFHEDYTYATICLYLAIQTNNQTLQDRSEKYLETMRPAVEFMPAVLH